MRIHYFNPGHETEVWLDKENYTPPAPVAQMRNELAALPIWYAEAGDAIYLETEQACRVSAFMEQLPREITPAVRLLDRRAIGATDLATAVVQPWGLSRPALRRFRQLKEETQAAFALPAWQASYKPLGSRRTAAVCLERIRRSLPDEQLPETPRFCRTLPEISRAVTSFQKRTGGHPCLLKTPYSSSGRGLLWLKGEPLATNEQKWVEGALAKQGEVSVEPVVDKVLDFALEYRADGHGEVEELGLSLFQTGAGGNYGSNSLQEQAALERQLIAYVGEQRLHRVRTAVRKALQTVLATDYAGYLGVDMLIYRRADGFAIHPCVEINLRYTMGLVALQLYRKWLFPGSTGRFLITYTKREGEAYASHCAMRQAYPLVIRDGRIVSGYLPLCPVMPETCFRAYSIIFAMPISNPRSSANPRRRPMQE